MGKHKWSKISIYHGVTLVYRSLLFIAALVYYIYNRFVRGDGGLDELLDVPAVMIIIWAAYAAQMIFRFFPSHIESMGCQKQFRRNFVPTKKTKPKILPNRVTVLIALGWLAFNLIFGVLYLVGIFDAGIMLLISLAFSVCDMICILFFCPFQTWFMKNKCCGSCRIYNWDYAMMFTPLVFVPSIYTYSLVAMALGILIRWEVTVYRHPERFSEETNACLSCAACEEKLCSHKKQLRKFIRANSHLLKLWKR